MAMTTPPTPAPSLVSLIDADPACAAQLRRAGSIEESVRIALAYARQHGLNVDANELLAHFNATPGPARHRQAGTALTDDALAGVAGGGTVIPDLNGPGTPRSNKQRVG